MFTKRQIVEGLSWKGAALAVQKAMHGILQLLLAYYLLPEHFGLVGMAGVFVGLVSSYADMGIGLALVQRKDEDLHPRHWHTAFWLNLGLSWGAFIIVITGMAPLAAWYYDADILRPLCMILGIGLVLNPLTFIHLLRIQKRLGFQRMFIINTVGTVCGGGGGVVMAMSGFGLWSIPGVTVIRAIVRVPIILSMESWKPAFVFDKGSAKEIFDIGIYDVMARLAGFFNSQMNILFLGGLFAPATVGYFVFASAFTTNMLKPINAVFKKVFFPFFSAIQDDPSRIRRYYLRQVKYSALFIFPLMFGLFLVAEDVLIFFFGRKWDGAVFPMQCLCVVVVMTALVGTPGVVLKSLGAFRLNLKLSMVKYVGIRAPCVLLGGLLWDFTGYLFGLLFSQLITSAIDLHCLRRAVRLEPWHIGQSVKTVVIGTISMAAAVLIIRNHLHSVSLYGLVGQSLGGAAVFSAAYFFLEKRSGRLAEGTKEA